MTHRRNATSGVSTQRGNSMNHVSMAYFIQLYSLYFNHPAMLNSLLVNATANPLAAPGSVGCLSGGDTSNKPLEWTDHLQLYATPS
jgi:hypothetical protein